MYFNISIVKKNKDKKEMILKAKSEEEIRKQTDKIKNYLFPDENNENLVCDISQFNNSISNDNEKYYKIDVMKNLSNDKQDDFFGSAYCDYIESALNFEDAFTKAKKELEKQSEDVDNYEIYVTALSVDQCIEREMDILKCEIKDQYIRSHVDLNLIPVREYFKIKASLDENNGDFYKAIIEYNRRLRIEKHIKRIAGYDKLTVREYDKFIKELLYTDDETQFNLIIEKLKEKLS